VLVLRFKEPGAREFRVPFNLKIGSTELPVGLAVIALILFALCLVNLLTKQVATISGVSFTIVFFAIFTFSEHTTRRRASAAAELDQFNLTPSEELTPETLGIRPGCVLVPARNYNSLYPLRTVLDRIDTHQQDVVVLHLRFLQRAGGGEYEL